MKIEKFVGRSTEVGKSKNGYVPSPAPVMSSNGNEIKGIVPSPAPNTQGASQIVKK
jgi:hypothetical protein